MRALGGTYFPLKNGVPTGFNPLQLPPTPSNIEFLKVWLQELSRARVQDGRASVRERVDLEQALRGTLALDPPDRRLSVCGIPLFHGSGRALRATWLLVRKPSWRRRRGVRQFCRHPRGAPSGHTVVGFDVTEFLDHAHTRASVFLYLFHLVRQLLDGRRLVCWMDEFWRLLADPAFENFAKDGPKTWRKLNAAMRLATQSASDVLQSSISRTLVEQTPTKVFFPNADASHDEYTQGFGLSEREFQLIKEQLEPGSRTFLVKQAHHSVVCRLDLKGFDAELAVISGRAAKVTEMSELIAARGPLPAHWLPAFMATNTDEREFPTGGVTVMGRIRWISMSLILFRRGHSGGTRAMGRHRCRRDRAAHTASADLAPTAHDRAGAAQSGAGGARDDARVVGACSRCSAARIAITCRPTLRS